MSTPIDDIIDSLEAAQREAKAVRRRCNVLVQQIARTIERFEALQTNGGHKEDERTANQAE